MKEPLFVAEALSHELTVTIIVGRTYPWREELKMMGCVWSPEARCWYKRGAFAFALLKALASAGARVLVVRAGEVEAESEPGPTPGLPDFDALAAAIL